MPLPVTATSTAVGMRRSRCEKVVGTVFNMGTTPTTESTEAPASSKTHVADTQDCCCHTYRTRTYTAVCICAIVFIIHTGYVPCGSTLIRMLAIR